MYLFNKKAIAIAVLSLTGCASAPESSSVHEKALSVVESASVAPVYGLKKIGSVAELPGGFVEKADAGSGRGDVSIAASGKLSSILAAISDNKYSISFVDGVDQNKMVSVSARNMSADAVIHQVAANAGYVAITNKENRSITIASQAAWTFRIPVRLMQRLSSTYSVGGTAGGSGGGAQSGGAAPAASGGGGSGGPAAGVASSFSASSSVAAGGPTKGGIEEFLKSVAGENADVSVSSETGYITVRGNGAALNRVHVFMNQFVYDSDRRAEIKVSIIEVSLNDNSSYGIDWSRVLAPKLGGDAGGLLSLVGGAASIVNPSFTLNFTAGSITGVIQALKTYAHVSVITQPSISALNRTPVAIFNGDTVPYVGSVGTTSTAVASTTSATTSFVDSGVSLSVMPDILSDTEAQITLSPSITSITQMNSFQVGSSTLIAPSTTVKKILMQTIVKNGQTVILGGIRENKNNKTTKTVPFFGVPLGGTGDEGAKEIVILLQSTVVPPQRVDTLVTESL